MVGSYNLLFVVRSSKVGSREFPSSNRYHILPCAVRDLREQNTPLRLQPRLLLIGKTVKWILWDFSKLGASKCRGFSLGDETRLGLSLVRWRTVSRFNVTHFSPAKRGFLAWCQIQNRLQGSCRSHIFLVIMSAIISLANWSFRMCVWGALARTRLSWVQNPLRARMSSLVLDFVLSCLRYSPQEGPLPRQRILMNI